MAEKFRLNGATNKPERHGRSGLFVFSKNHLPVLLFFVILQSKRCEVRLHLGIKNKQVCFILLSVCTNFAQKSYKEHRNLACALRKNPQGTQASRLCFNGKL